MLNIPRQKFEKFRKLLLTRKKEVEEEIDRIKKEDPVMSDSLAESSEPGTDSWMADVHTKAQALKASLQEILTKTKESLMNLNSGKYGKCRKCGKDIEMARLEAMPTADLCISCSKSKK